MSNSIFSANWNEASEGDAAYSRVSVPAVISFLFGIASALIYVNVWLAFIAVISILIAVPALYSIRNSGGTLTGKGFAYAGIFLPVLFLILFAAFWQCYFMMLNRQSDKFFRGYFAAALDGNIPKMKSFFTFPPEKTSLDTEVWWKEQYADKFKHQSLHTFTDNEMVRTLTALGHKAKITYYRTPEISAEGESDRIVKYFAVTYNGASGMPETFFIKMSGVRYYSPNVKRYGWRMSAFPAIVVPEEYKE
ncbi:MAG: DUF4190 domain-containing protein [Planctomycetaceae bacterium]|jgi:hypothetical protein|nr:DUF4190 domain-containing protein [Planctomycetaceae bacterium]